jgi:hypothetical protein
MKKHYFAVFATIAEDGTVQFGIDNEVYGLDTNNPVWDDENNEWLAVSPALSDNDELIRNELISAFESYYDMNPTDSE